GIAALLLAEDDDAAAAEAAEPAEDGAILAEAAVAGERRPVRHERIDVVAGVRPLGMSGNLNLLPRAELGIGLPEQAVGLRFEPRHLVGDVEIAGVREMAELLDLALELGDRPLEIE